MTRYSCRRGADERTVSARTTANCVALKTRFRQIEFALNDTILYLDSYPECRKALAYYHRLLDEREQLIKAINEQCGPMTNLGNLSTESWRWIDGPWPWMIDAD
jgi:spore coat protein JB